MKKILRGKKAWMRIVEAVIAVLLVASVFTFILVRNNQRQTSEEIDQLARTLVSEIGNIKELRLEILNKDLSKGSVDITKGEVYKFLVDRIPKYLEFKARVCKIDDVCGMNEYIEKRIYVHETIIVAEVGNDDKYAPRKLKLFLWEK